MQNLDNQIALNFLSINSIGFNFVFYYKKIVDISIEEQRNYYQRSLKEVGNNQKTERFAILFNEKNGFAKKEVSSNYDIGLTKQFLFQLLNNNLKRENISKFENNSDRHHRIYLPLKEHIEGIETVWIEPYYLERIKSYGFLIDYKFWVDADYKNKINTSVDKKILQLSGTLDSKGYSNKASYQFKYEKLKAFLSMYSPVFKNLEAAGSFLDVSLDFALLEAFSLSPKTYQFYAEKENNSSFMGLKQYYPYQKPENGTDFLFVFKESDRGVAINLLNGLKGISFPSTFSGIESMFKIPFSNNNIKGKKVDELTIETLNDIINEILLNRTEGANVLPIVLTNSKTDDRLYYTIKYAFTKHNIPCQVVTKDLLMNSNVLKYSLSNIGLQIFAKSGGKPWKVKPALNECLIIGIGNKNKEAFLVDNNGVSRKKIEKFLTYSVLTDSSGLFKEIKLLSETDNEEDYYKSLISKLKAIISKAAEDGNKDIVIHSPFRISKEKVWNNVFKDISTDIRVSILLINDFHKYFGFDFSKNALVPYESTAVALSENEYIVWFEGLQHNNLPFSKPIGSPIYINFWHSNQQGLLQNPSYRQNLLQDCINLSGANWRGFKAKQLPVSIYYCQKIADFLKKFEDYKFEHVELENLKPWFL